MIKKILTYVTLGLILMGCKQSTRTSEKPTIVRMYSGGQMVQSWTNITKLQKDARGPVSFRDENGERVYIRGEYLITW